MEQINAEKRVLKLTIWYLMFIGKENYIRVAEKWRTVYTDATVRLLLKVGNVAVMEIEASWGLVFVAT